MVRFFAYAKDAGTLELIKSVFEKWEIPQVDWSQAVWTVDPQVQKFEIQYSIGAREACEHLLNKLKTLEISATEFSNAEDIVHVYACNPACRNDNEKSRKKSVKLPKFFLKCNSNSFLAKAGSTMRQMGIDFTHEKVGSVRESRIECNTGNPVHRDVARLIQLLFLGQDQEIPVRPAGQDDFRIFASSRKIQSKPLRQQFDVHVFTDDMAVAKSLMQPLEKVGYNLVCRNWESFVELWKDGRVLSKSLKLISSFALTRFAAHFSDIQNEYPELYEEIQSEFHGILANLGVDPKAMPVDEIQISETAGVALVFPIKAYCEQRIVPYAEGLPSRLQAQIDADDFRLTHKLHEFLSGQGFHSVELKRWPYDPEPGFPAVYWPQNFTDVSWMHRIQENVQGIVQEYASFLKVENLWHSFRNDVVYVYLPVRKARIIGEESYWKEYASRIQLELYGFGGASGQNSGRNVNFILECLHSMGFSNVKIIPEKRDAGIRHGLVSRQFLHRLTDFFNKVFEEDIPMVSMTDNVSATVEVSIDKELPDFQTLVSRVGMLKDVAAALEAETGVFPFLAPAGDEILRVGQWRLPFPRRKQRHPLAPAADDFKYFVLDATAAKTLDVIASAVALREPCLLEGETSTAKTSSILYLAHHLGQPVIRFNLNGQTETSELIGRWVPSRLGEGWEWRDGAVVQAMKEGYWLILDEMNLGHPEVLERLNSVLEKNPSLVLSEKDSSVLRFSDVHPDFRVFATMNPASYAGRSPVSPALRDRFRCYYYVPLPTDQDIEIFLHGVVFASKRKIPVDGVKYFNSPPVAGFSRLSESDGFSQILPSLARFHVDITQAFIEVPGAPGDEPIAFTRRALLSLLEYLSVHPGKLTEETLQKGIERYYLGRLNGKGRELAMKLLDASGLLRHWKAGEK